MKRHILILTAFAIVCLLVACDRARIPAEYANSNALPKIYPDYADVTVPVNIAPLTFELDQAADEFVARYAFGDDEIICGGSKAQPAINDWRRLTGKAAGKAIEVEIYAREGEKWTKFKPFRIFVSPDSIDPYISYRLIAPSYITYEELTINQRCLENYDESVIYDNMLCSFEKDGQCINCHSYQQYNPARMQFHARQQHGGTVITYDGKTMKANLQHDSLLSAGVYPSWHPWLKLIAYSTDKTHQSFHVTNRNKIEVFDTESDLIAYDVERNEVTHVANDPNEFEVFPFWAPDGRSLYYCSAHLELRDTTLTRSAAIVASIDSLKYNIYHKSFNPETRQFGERQMVFDAAAHNASAALPRISPNGQFLVFTLGKYGYFHIWHREADLWMLDLQTGEARPLAELNSPETESYHAWSSNGRWLIFSSRRDDGVYTRPFIAHIDKQGRGSKPFELPTADPDYHRQFMKSYNIPEFMRGAITISPQQFADILKGKGQAPAKYVPQLTPAKQAHP